MLHLIANSLSVLSEFKHEVVITLMVTGFLAAVAYPFRQAKAKWDAMTTKLDDVHKELTTQRSNCLATLQSQGTQQIEFLEKAVDALNDIKGDNREVLGYLRSKL
jgi:hypothetical protein